MRTALLLGGLVACSGGPHTDIKPTLVLADRSDAEIDRIVSGAAGTDMFSAEAQVDQFSSSITADPCPGIAIAGKTVTLTGGCTTTDGIAIAGTATLGNPAAWDSVPYDYSAASTFDFIGLSFTQSGYTTTFDGSFEIADSFATYTADITSETLGIALRSNLFISCDRGSLDCTFDGSGLELPGVGGVTISGVVHAKTNTEAFTVQGRDRMTVAVANGCVAWSIDGTSRAKTCP
jgi:hypothetical protein